MTARTELLASVGEVDLNPTDQKCLLSEGSLSVKLWCRHQRTINLFLSPVFLFPEIHTAMLVAFSPVYPLPIYMNSYVTTVGLYRKDTVVFLALRRPEYTSYRLIFGLPLSGRIAQTLLQLPSLCIGP